MKREEIELEVFDLLESKDFQELSSSQQSKVLSVMSRAEYELQRRIIVEAQNTEEMVAGPLVFPEKRSIVPIWFASIGSAAAAAILVFLVMKPAKVEDIKESTVKTQVIRDTLIVENTVTDTILDYRIVKVKDPNCGVVETAMIQVPESIPNAPNVPPMRDKELANSGVSAANDNVVETFRTQPFIGM